MEELVHIIPLGFEIDRAVKPFNHFKANKAYVLYSPSKRKKDGTGKPEYFRDKVVKSLEARGIKVVTVEYNIFDVLDAMAKISSIIAKEKNEHNHVYVNMSSASTMSAVAASLVAMYQDVKVYYVKSDGNAHNEEEIRERGYSIVDNADITWLANFKIDIPTGAKIDFLVELYKHNKMTTKDIEAMIKEDRLDGFEDLKDKIGSYGHLQLVSMRINKSLLSELKQKDYIKIEKKGRNNHITITDKGKYAACLSGKI